eukprot:4355037-Pyramimonas_sp.AAC.1
MQTGLHAPELRVRLLKRDVLIAAWPAHLEPVAHWRQRDTGQAAAPLDVHVNPEAVTEHGVGRPMVSPPGD